MTFNNDNICRKSSGRIFDGKKAWKSDAECPLSVYNQTGQSYFQQLTAYNHMSAHLRRLLLALSVVDSRNEKYARERDKQRRQRRRLLGWTVPCRSGSANDILQGCRNVIEGLACDTKHNPIDVLRMSLENNCVCRSRKRQESAETCVASRRQSRKGHVEREVVPAKMVGRRQIDSRGSPDRTRLISADSRCSRERRRESHDETYTEFSTRVATSCESSSTRKNSPERSDVWENTYSGRLERQAEEAKYAKFIYDITQEIMINGLYTDDELQAIFDKHLCINSGLLARDKMQAEIYRLRISLNLATMNLEDEDEEDVERFFASGKFADLSPNKPPTPPKILDRDKIVDKIRDACEESTMPDETRRQSRKSNNRKNTVVLVDANPELLITERDVLVTLMEMNLEPHQVETINRSLRIKSRDPAHAKTVEVAAAACSSPKREDRANSPIVWEPESRSSQLFRTSEGRDETTGTVNRRHRSV